MNYSNISLIIHILLFTDSAFLKSLELNLSRLIAYCESADVSLQREVQCTNRLHTREDSIDEALKQH